MGVDQNYQYLVVILIMTVICKIILYVKMKNVCIKDKILDVVGHEVCQGKGIDYIFATNYGCRSELPIPSCNSNNDCDMENNFVCENEKCVFDI